MAPSLCPKMGGSSITSIIRHARIFPTAPIEMGKWSTVNASSTPTQEHPTWCAGSGGHNEFLASNTNSLIIPATGRYDDWIELYNFGSVPIDLSGFYLRRRPQRRKNSGFSRLARPSPRGDICWFGQTMPRLIALRAICTRIFQLSRNGEQIGLFTPTIDCGFSHLRPQGNNISQGRYRTETSPACSIYDVAHTASSEHRSGQSICARVAGNRQSGGHEGR